MDSIIGRRAARTPGITSCVAAIACGCLALNAAASAAQVTVPKRDSAYTLPELSVRAKASRAPDTANVPAIQQLTLPITASVTAARARSTINLVDPEDAIRYQPTVYLRKRNYGDYQSTLATRVWGVGSSARSLVFADGVPITALVANNNTIGAPRWGLVAPEEIQRVDMMYGPFSAAYAGNSMGAVVEITTRRPERLEASLTQTGAVQAFQLYDTDRSFGTSQTSGYVADRFGRLSISLSGNYLTSRSQPLAYVTSATFPNGTSGGIPETNKLDAPANVLGATGLLDTRMANGKAKIGFDITPSLRAAYTFALWTNNSDSRVQSFLDASGQPTYAGQAGFASNYYQFRERHTAHSLSLRTASNGDLDFEAVGTRYNFDKDQQRFPTSASATGTTFGTAGRLASLDGTGWTTLDLKGAWHAGGAAIARHTVTAGVHYDRYQLRNPTFAIADWRNGDSSDATGIVTRGEGTTRTQALWAQDRWRITPSVSLTFGGRLEGWRAYDGVNVSGATRVEQPELSLSKFSPKAVLAWEASPVWTFTASAGRAYRFATVAELYQLVSTGTTFTSPDATLKPDNAFSTELRADAHFDRASLRVALFQDDVHDAIISQFLPLVANSATLYSYLANVDHVRGRGIELSGGSNDVIRHFDVSGSVTYVDAKTLEISGRASATAPVGSAIGKQLPNIPTWRANGLVTWLPSDRASLAIGGRYSSKLYTTLDNADVNFDTYQAFGAWFVADAKFNYRFSDQFSASLGVDNLNNRKYFLFHPFPQRTVVAAVTLRR